MSNRSQSGVWSALIGRFWIIEIIFSKLNHNNIILMNDIVCIDHLGKIQFESLSAKFTHLMLVLHKSSLMELCAIFPGEVLFFQIAIMKLARLC